ncbi:hypothetical protein [Streptomyces melanogenes]|uniref:Uncharacterized protein n=1 Tax=Streptomyces melanogenes TaxID=67326 RepID=A0ABZ1XXC0_9ACTN|nr:hypothetical protein [Streptomyces melanogenes]
MKTIGRSVRGGDVEAYSIRIDAGLSIGSGIREGMANAVRTAAAPVTAEEAVGVEGVFRHRPCLLVTEERAPQGSACPTFRLTPTES